MKTLVSIICALMCSFTMMAQTSAQKYAETTNAHCPQSPSDGLVWTATVFEPETMTLTIALTVDAAVVPFDALKASADMLREGKMAEILTATDADNKLLREACAKEGVTIAYVFSSGNDSFSMLIKPVDLK